ITAAYACTDYRAQGQTISALVIDIGTPPSGGLSLFNLYVAMSRMPELTAEDERLEALSRRTKTWWERVRAGEDLLQLSRSTYDMISIIVCVWQTR
ncbi:hypothetical protein BU15DRAFT_57226, partial [Melanogaster broomeanus]